MKTGEKGEGTSSEEVAGRIVDVLGVVAFLNAAITGMASAGAQAYASAHPLAEGCAPVMLLDHAQAHGLTQILTDLDVKLTAICEGLLEEEGATTQEKVGGTQHA